MIHPKVAAAGTTGGLATVVVAILAALGVTGPIVPVVAAVVTILTFAAGYFKSGPSVVATVTGDVEAAAPTIEAMAPVIEPIVVAAVEKALAAHATPVPVTPAAPAS